MKRTLLLLLFCLPLTLLAESIDQIKNSGIYYFGEGFGKTKDEAIQLALDALNRNIVTHVSSKFSEVDDQTVKNGSVEHESRVLNIVKSYSEATLHNVQSYWLSEKENKYSVILFMEKAEMEKVYAERRERAKNMIALAQEALESANIDIALQNYYAAYSLVRSLEDKTSASDNKGHLLIDWLPVQIEKVLSDVSVSVERREGNHVDLLFSYRGKPVSSLEFNYNDGRQQCQGLHVMDGHGSITMAPDHEAEVYHIDVEYEFKDYWRGEPSVEPVMSVMPKKPMRGAAKTVKAPATAAERKAVARLAEQAGINLKPSKSQVVSSDADYAALMQQVIGAIEKRRYQSVNHMFQVNGLSRWNSLIKYGESHIVGTPRLQFFKGLNGEVVARGLQMSFDFSRGTKRSFVEDVVFTFNQDKKICNVTLGLGQVATNDILCKHTAWGDERREMMMEFLENYKTAYCLRDYEYIKNVFADDAIIITGRVVKRANSNGLHRNDELPMSQSGHDIIKYNKQTKAEYLKNLKRCFDNNEMINLHFTNNDIQRLDKVTGRTQFGIQIGQEYNSTTYADKGYLFLLVDMTDQQQPQIKIRTWQPNEEDMDKLYNAGSFFRED